MSRKLKKVMSILLALVLIVPTSWLGPVVSAENSKSAEPEIVYHESFVNGGGIATQSGGATLTPVTGKAFNGNEDGAALYVSNRANDFDAADFSFANTGLENGQTYTVTVTGYVDSDVSVPTGAQAVLSTVDSYTWLSNVNFVAGQPFTLTKEFIVNTNSDSKLRVQSNSDGKTVPFYIGEILITTSSTTDNVSTVYHETFENGAGFATQSGGANLNPVTGKVFEGNEDGAALHVTNRANDYDAADFSFANIGLENGKTYTVTVKGYVDTDVTVPTGSQAVLSTVDSYTWLSNVNFVAGQAFTLTDEFTVDSSRDSKIRIQSNATGATVPFYIGDVLITEKISTEEPPTPPRDPAIEFKTIDFEDQNTGGFEGRAGTETLTVTNEANHTEGGSYALKVENRTNTWHGPTLRVENYVDLGYEYKISAWVKLLTPDSSQIQLSTQVGNENASYNNILGKTISTSDGWVLYEGTYRYTSAPDEFITIYVESSNNSTASFYIDDISFTPTGSGPITVQDLPPIKDAYQNDFLIGSAVSAQDLEGVRLQLLNMHHNVATAENAMKPGELQATKGTFTFEGADDLVNSVIAEGHQAFGHVLVWHQQSPDWMNTSTDSNGNTVPLGREEALANMRTHIQTVVEHFGERVIGWDVVNEAMNDNPSNPSDWKASLRKSNWYHSIGEDYVEQAFLAAKEVIDQNNWDIKLYYNDYNDDNQNKAEAIYQMVREINERYASTHNGELLIDGIGMQGHYNLSTNPENVRLSLEKFISLGVEVSVTELDIQAGSNGVQTEAEAIAQGYLYAKLFEIYKEHSEHIARVTFWGLNDSNSWRASSSPLLFDADLQAKPAYYAVMDPTKFIEDYPPVIRENKVSIAVAGTPTIDGTTDDVWIGVPEIPVNQYLMAWQGASGVAKALWDQNYLYVLVNVSDDTLDKTNDNPWEHDSVEVFLDQTNAKTSFYQEDDGQYRVNYDNETSFNPASIKEGFESATKVSGTNYTVEMKIPLNHVTPANGVEVGFDVQINDAKNGSRQSVATWNDNTGNGYMDTSAYGVLNLTSPPPAPSDLVTTVESSDTIILDWEYASEESVTFEVYRGSAAEGPFTRVGENLTESMFTDTNLESNTTYFYYVKAIKAPLTSEASITVSALTKMDSVENFTAKALNHKTIKLVWDAVEGSVTYSVYRSTESKGEYTLVKKNLTDSEFVDNLLTSLTTYYYKVVAVNEVNESDPAGVQVTTKADPRTKKSN